MKLPAIGDVVGDRFRVESIIGEGGFGVVYAAADLSSGHRCALKVLRPGRRGYDVTTRRRFDREAAILGRVKSPHVVRMFAHGEIDGLLFMQFELLRGEDLSDVLARRGRFEPTEVVQILRQLLGALDETHRAGVLHRDIKPDNVRVVGETDGIPLLTLIDFGIARLTDEGSPSITATGEVIGTPRYMSPEQLTGRPLTPASDVYSVGIMTLELLLGTEAMHGNTWGAQIDRLRSGHVFSLPGLEQYGAALLNVLRRMTAREQAQRFGSAAAVLSALDRLDDDPPAAPRIPSEQARSPSVATLLVRAAVVLLPIAAIVILSADKTQPTYSPRPTSRSPSAVVHQDAAMPPAEHPDVPMPPDSGGDDDDPCGQVSPFEGQHQFAGHPLYVPPTYQPSRRHPLVILLHVDYQEPGRFLHDSGFRKLAEQHGFLVVAPRDPASVANASAWRSGGGSIEAVWTAVDNIQQMFCVDSDRVFVVGVENGGAVAHQLACDARIAAFATFAHVRGGIIECPPRAAKPFLALRSTGGDRRGACSVRFVSDTRLDTAWKQRNSCDESAPTENRLGDTICRSWSCAVPYQRCEVAGGNLWPGSSANGMMRCLGAPATRLAVADHIWSFFDTVAPTEPAAER